MKNNVKNNIVENYETVKTTKRIITSNIRKINRKKSKNEIISGGTLSIIKLPNRRINYSESEDVFTHIKETQKKIAVLQEKERNRHKYNRDTEIF